jgi:hypothetical protein
MLQKGLDELRKLTCRWIYKRRLSSYLDHELSDFDARTTANHLNECARCRGELEQLRFAKRALAEFDIPLITGQLPGGNVFRLPLVKQVSPLKRLAYHKIQVPLPVAASLLICLISVTLLAVFGGQQNQGQSSTASPSVIIERVEVPVVRVITRTVHVKQPVSRRAQNSSEKEMKPLNSPHSKENIAQNNSKSAEWSEDVLKGFRPAVDANLRVIKEDEK